jgi:hypothetical protein
MNDKKFGIRKEKDRGKNVTMATRDITPREHLTNEEVGRRAGIESMVKKVEVRMRWFGDLIRNE